MPGLRDCRSLGHLTSYDQADSAGLFLVACWLCFVCLFGRGLVRSRLLALLQLLLLLRVLLRQLLRLLLVLLFHLLLPRLISRSLWDALMILLLPGLEFLALVDLFRFEFLLLLLESQIILGVAGVWSGRAFCWGNIPGMHWRARATDLVVRTPGLRVVGAVVLVVRTSIVVPGCGGTMNCATFSGGHCATVSEGSRLGCSSDGRLPVILGGA